MAQGPSEAAGKPAGAVFLSYASEDLEAAQRVCEALRAAGIEVWFDRAELRGGDAWDRKIRQQIHDCALFLPIVSANTEARLEGYFRREWRIAVDRLQDMDEGKPFLVPIVIDATNERSAHVPDALRAVQWSRLTDGEASSAFVAHVLALLGGVAESRVDGRPASHGVIAEAHRKPGRRRAWLVVGPAMLAAVAAGAWLAWRQMPLHAPAESVAAAGPSSIAVLPFADMSEKRDQEYFADGMAEEIIDQLAKVPQLKVISRTSSFQYKGKSADARTIGAAIGARYLVEGSVRKSGGQLRVTAQLIDATDGSQRWAERYDRDVGDALGVQDAIATSLVRALEIGVGAFELPPRTALRVPAAYEAYLRARHAEDRFNQKGFEEALAYYRESLRLDPRFARAAAGLAELQANLGEWGYLPVETAFAEATASANLAIALDASLAKPHATLAYVHLLHDWDWSAAKRELEQAFALEPRDATTAKIAGNVSMALGAWDQAARYIEASLAIDPLDAGAYYVLCSIKLRAGHPDEAEAAIRRAIQISPSYAFGYTALVATLVARGKLEEALSVAQQEPDMEARLWSLSYVYFALGRRTAADDALLQLTKLAAGDWAYGIAGLHASRGEADEAFRWLDRAYAQKDVDLPVIKGDPTFVRIVADPRYKALLRKMNLPES